MPVVEGKTELKERFIEARAAGRSYADIAAELKISKPTLIAWARELVREIRNARTIRTDELFERFAIAKTKRIEAFGKRLQGILGELDKRTLTDIKTEALLSLALKYGEVMRAEYEELKIEGAPEETKDFLGEKTTFIPRWPI